MKMLKATLAGVAVVTLALVGVATADCGHCHFGKGHGACVGKGDCPGYNTKAATTFQAKVVSINREKCEGCGMTYVDLVVKTEADEATVRLGPAWYIDNQEDLLKTDDVVDIYASRAAEDGDFFVAGKITKGDDVLILRDKDGRPMWQGWRRGNA